MTNLTNPAFPEGVDPGVLPQRQRQVLVALLEGYSEKEAAEAMKISRHTLHIYVKSLYERLGVNTRGELLARFIPPSMVAALARGRIPEDNVVEVDPDMRRLLPKDQDDVIEVDPDLQRLMESWPDLPEVIRQRMLGMAEAAQLIARATPKPAR